MRALPFISSKENVTFPLFDQKDLSVTDAAYIHLKSTAVKPWMKIIAEDRYYVFEQDVFPA